MTNLIAAITVIVATNIQEQIIEYDRYEPCPCPDGQIGCLVNHTRGVNPTKKEVLITVTETSVCQFDWLGKPRMIEERRTLSESRKYYQLTTAWTRVAPPDLPMPPFPGNLTNTQLLGTATNINLRTNRFVWQN